MIVLNDHVFLFSVAYIVSFILYGIVSIMCVTLTGIFSVLLSVSENDHSDQFRTVPLSGIIENIISKGTSLVAQCIVYAFRTLLLLFPFIVAVLVLALVRENSALFLTTIESAYNLFLVDSGVVSGIRSMLWVFKISAEVFLPIWNFVIDTGKRIVINLGKLILFDSNVKESIRTILLEIGNFLVDIVVGMWEYAREMWGCRYFQLQASETFQCLDFKHRALDVTESLQHMQNVVSTTLDLVVSLCPLGLGFIEVLLHPLTQKELSLVINNALNLFLQLVFDIWDVTHLRCRVAIDNSLTAAYCIPDINPPFYYFMQITTLSAKILDSWAEKCLSQIFGIFMTCSTDGVRRVTVTSQKIQAWQDQDTPFVAVALSSSNVAMVTANEVFYTASQSSVSLASPVDMQIGVVPVSFSRSADEIEEDSRMTGIMGCTCSGNLVITCHVLPFSGTGDAQVRQHPVQVNFANANAQKLLTCRDVQITLETVRFPQITSRRKDTRLAVLPGDAFPSATACRENPGMDCNTIDAVLYVKPLCRRDDLFGAEAVQPNRVACVEGYRYMPCFPYCLGVRQSFSGSRAITMYNKREIENGVWYSNLQCFSNRVPSASSRAVISSTLSVTGELPDPLATDDTTEFADSRCESQAGATSIVSDNNPSEQAPDTGNDNFVWAFEQPFAFAGDTMLIPTCHIRNGGCVWTTDAKRLTSSIMGRHQVQDSVTTIPSENADAWLTMREYTGSAILPIPYLTYSTLSVKNLAAQTRRGLFYALNGDDTMVPEQDLFCQRNAGISSPSFWRTSRLFFTSPRYECDAGEVPASGERNMFDGTAARMCTGNMTREIAFTGNDQFWSWKNRATEGALNMFIDHLSLLDEQRVLVRVRRGSLLYFEHESGHRSWGEACQTRDGSTQVPDGRMKGEYVYYTIDTETLAVTRADFDRVLAAQYQDCAFDLFPNVVSLGASAAKIGIEAMGVLANRYLLNLFGIIESMNGKITGDIALIANLQHDAYSNYTGDGSLSLARPKDQVVAFVQHTDRVAVQTFRFLSLFLGLDPFLVQWTQSGILVAIRMATGSMLTAVMTGYYVWDYVFLPLVRDLVQSDADDTIFYYVQRVNNHIYDTLQDDKFRSTVLAPLTMFCNEVPHITFDANGALGQTVFHACRAVVEGVHAVVDIASTMLVFSDFNTCLCRGGLDGSDACIAKMPATLQAQYRVFRNFLAKQERLNDPDAYFCEETVRQFEVNLKFMLTPVVRHVDAAMLAVMNAPGELAANFGLHDDLSRACTDYTMTNTAAHITTLTPQPVYAFHRCGYTQRCQQRCATDIQLFVQQKLQVAAPNRVVRGLFDNRIPTTLQDIEGMDEQEAFEPVAMEQYVNDNEFDTSCSRYFVVIARKIPGDGDQRDLYNREWVYYVLCEKISDISATVFLRQEARGSLAAGSGFFLPSDFDDVSAKNRAQQQIDKQQVIDVILVPSRKAGYHFHALFVSWSRGLAKTIVTEISVATSGVQGERVVFDSLMHIAEPKSCNNNDEFLPSEFKYEIDDDHTNKLQNGEDVNSLYDFNPVLTHVSLMPGEGQGYAFLFRVRAYASSYAPETPPSVTRDSQALPGYISRHGIVEVLPDSTVLCTFVDQKQGDGVASITHLSTLVHLQSTADLSFMLERLADDDANQNNHHHGIAVFRGIEITEGANQVQKTLYFLNATDNTLIPSNKPPMIFKKRPVENSLWRYEPSRYTFHRSVFGLDTCRARILNPKLPIESARVERPYSALGCNQVVSSGKVSWIRELNTVRLDSSAQEYTIQEDDTLSLVEVQEMEQSCNFMNCFACTDDVLRQRCYAAQNCAISRCVSTTINHENLFCIGGGLVKETVDIVVSDATSAYLGAVEVYIGIFSLSQNRIRGKSIDIQALSEFATGRFCELKDLTVQVAAIIPATVSTIYHITKLKVSNKGRLSSLQIDLISPRFELMIRSFTGYVTEVINAILLGAVHLLYMNAKLVLCGSDKLAELSGNFINIIDNTVGDENNICSLLEGAANQGLALSDNQIIEQNMMRDFGGLDVRVEAQYSNGYLTNFKRSFTRMAPNLMLIRRNYPKFLLINSLTTGFDWLVGLLSSVGRLMTLFDDASCRPQGSNLAHMAQCVCGDKPYQIVAKHALQTYDDSAFWCSGILQVLDGAGTPRLVYNPHSFSALKQEFDGEFIAYLTCVDSGRDDCSITTSNPHARRWQDIGISPLSILTKCRSNYASKSWDVGAFALYNEDTWSAKVQRNSRAEITAGERDRIRAALASHPMTVLCLRDGPQKNTIEQCMQQFFDENKTSVMEYFQYSADGRGGTIPRDACEFLSLQTENTILHDKIQQCRAPSEYQCDSLAHGGTCDVLFSTNNLLSGTSSNAVSVFERTYAAADVTPEDVQRDYEQVKTCAVDAIQHGIDKLNVEFENALLDFFSMEGDMVHQRLDCIIMGGYNSLTVVPALPDTSRDFIYARNDNLTRAFTVPCDVSLVTSNTSSAALEYETKTCGTSARKAFVSYFVQDFLSGEYLNKVVQDMAIAKLEELKANFSDVTVYAARSADQLDFRPQFDVTLQIQINNIIDQIIDTNNIQFQSINDTQVWTKWQDVAMQNYIESYNDDASQMRAVGNFYPVDGIADFDATSYQFPFNRDKDPLNVLQQCHGLLRSSFSTHHITEDADDFYTFSIIRDMLAENREWNPLDPDKNAHGPATRVEMIRRLMQEGLHEENAIHALLDERYVAENSTFCEQTGEDWLYEENFFEISDDDHLLQPENIDNIKIRNLGFYSRIIGNVEHQCPCASRSTQASHCCFQTNSASNAFLEKHKHTVQGQFQDEGAKFCYLRATPNIRTVRTWLRRDDFQETPCPENQPSSLMGLLPHNTSQYFEGSSHAAINSADLFLFPRSGLTLKHLIRHSELHLATEQNRRIDILNESNPVKNPACNNPRLTEHVIAEYGFPVLTSVAESPATAACLRYILEEAWLAVLTKQAVGDELLSLQAETRDVWASRCTVMLKKIQTCESMNAYSVDFTKQMRPSHRASACSFDVQDDASFALSTQACIILTTDARMFDPHACLRLSTSESKTITSSMLVADCEVLNPSRMLSREREMKTLDPVRLLSYDFAHNVATNASFRKELGVLGLSRGVDFWFPEIHHDRAERQQRQCSPTLAYWPRTWMYPLGESLVDEPNHAVGFSTYQAAIVDDDDQDKVREIAILPTILRADKLSQTVSGSAGFCREPSFGMETRATNQLRLCTPSRENTDITEGSEDLQTCSDTSAVSVGAGTGHTLGYNYPQLRPFVYRDESDPTKLRINTSAVPMHKIMDMFDKLGESLELDIEPDAETLEEDAVKYCDFEEAFELDRDLSRNCESNQDCEEDLGQVCNFEGECKEVSFTVINQMDDGVEVGMSSRKIPDAENAIKGASPWQQVSSLLQLHGWCSHKNAITYERMIKVLRNKNDNCMEKTFGEYTVIICNRNNSTYDFIVNPPRSLFAPTPSADSPNFALPEYEVNRHQSSVILSTADLSAEVATNEFLLEYASDISEDPDVPVQDMQDPSMLDTQFEFLKQQAHMCDTEFMNAHNLRWLTVKHKQESNYYSYWMRTAPSDDKFALYDRKKTTPNDDDAQKACQLGDTSGETCYAADKLRFMGLWRSNLSYFADDAPQEVMTNGKGCGLCTKEKFTFGGHRIPRTVNGNEFKTLMSTNDCGSFGYSSETDGKCTLDISVAFMPYLLMNGTENDESCNSVFKTIDNILKESTDKTTITYEQAQKENVKQYLNGVFLVRDAVLKSDQNQYKKLFYFRRCVSDVTTFLTKNKNEMMKHPLSFVNTYIDDANKNPLKRLNDVQKFSWSTSGFYYFLNFNTIEVPILWWEKYALEHLFFETRYSKTLQDADINDWTRRSTPFVVESWDHRTEHSLMNENTNHRLQLEITTNLFVSSDDSRDFAEKLKLLWSSLNTQMIVPQKDLLIPKIALAIAQSMTRIGSTKDTYVYGLPSDVSFAKNTDVRTTMPDQIETFYNKLSDLIATASKSTLKTVKDEIMVQMTSNPFEMSSGQHFDYKNQYHHRTMQPFLSNNRANVYTAEDSRTQFMTTAPWQGTNHFFPDRYFHGNYEISSAVGRSTVKSTIFRELGVFAVDSRFVRPDAHAFMGDLIHTRIENDGRILFLDPLLSNDNLNTLLNEMPTFIRDQLQSKNDIIPLLLVELPSASDLTNDDFTQLLDEVLAKKSTVEGCDGNAGENNLEILDASNVSNSRIQNKRCIFNPRRRESRRKETEKDTEFIEKKASVTITTNTGSESTWALCDLLSVRQNGYATPGEKIQDGVPCSFSDFSEVQGLQSRYEQTRLCETFSPASSFCDPPVDATKTEVNFERVFSNKRSCDSTRRAQYLHNDPTLHKSGSMPVYAGQIYLSNIKSASQRKRNRHKLCHRIDNACVANNLRAKTDAYVNDPHKDLFNLTSSTESNIFDDAYEALKKRNPDQQPFASPKATSTQKGPMCQVKSIKAPAKVNVKAWRLNSNFSDIASFTQATLHDRVLFKKSHSNAAVQMGFDHHFQSSSPHVTTPMPSASYCPASDSDSSDTYFLKYTNLHRFKRVNFNHTDLYKKIRNPDAANLNFQTAFGTMNADLEVDTGKATYYHERFNFPTINRWVSRKMYNDKFLKYVHGDSNEFDPIFASDYCNDQSLVWYPTECAENTNNNNLKKAYYIRDHQDTWQQKVSFTPQGAVSTSSPAIDSNYLCKPPSWHDSSRSITVKVDIWDLATCYQNKIDAQDQYFWTSQSLSDMLSNVLDGKLSLFFFKYMTRAHDVWKASAFNSDSFQNTDYEFQFSELMTGSQLVDGKKWIAAMQDTTWDDENVKLTDDFGINFMDHAFDDESLKKRMFGLRYENMKNPRAPKNIFASEHTQPWYKNSIRRTRTVPYIPGFFSSEKCPAPPPLGGELNDQVKTYASEAKLLNSLEKVNMDHTRYFLRKKDPVEAPPEDDPMKIIDFYTQNPPDADKFGGKDMERYGFRTDDREASFQYAYHELWWKKNTKQRKRGTSFMQAVHRTPEEDYTTSEGRSGRPYDNSNFFGTYYCWDEQQAGAYIARRGIVNTGEDNLEGNQRTLFWNKQANEQSVKDRTEEYVERTRNFWKDFASLRNLKYGQHVCMCDGTTGEDESHTVPLWRNTPHSPSLAESGMVNTPFSYQESTSRYLYDGGLIFSAWGIHGNHREDCPEEDVKECSKAGCPCKWWQWLIPGYNTYCTAKEIGNQAKIDMEIVGDKPIECTQGLLRESGLESCQAINDYRSYVAKIPSDNPYATTVDIMPVFSKKCENNDVANFDNPELFHRHPSSVKKGAECKAYCASYAAADKNVKGQIKSKLLGVNLRRDFDTESTSFDTATPLALCLPGDLKSNTKTYLTVDYYLGTFHRKPSPTYQYEFFADEAQSRYPVASEQVSKTLFQRFHGTGDGASENYANGATFLGGSENIFATKPSFWADVESNPGEYLVPCKPDDLDPQCMHIFEEINFEEPGQTQYKKSQIDTNGMITYEYTGSAPTEFICSYELEMPEDTSGNSDISECDFQCGVSTGNACSLHLEESADRCYLESTKPTTSELKSMLGFMGDTSSHLNFCKKCDTYDTTAAAIAKGDMNKTCLGRGVYETITVNSNEYYHPTSHELDHGNIYQWVKDLFDDISNKATTKGQRDNLLLYIKQNLQKQKLQMTAENSVILQGLHVDILIDDQQSNPWLHIYLDIIKDDMQTTPDKDIRENIKRQTQAWRLRNEESASTILAYGQTEGKTPSGHFQRFDPHSEVKNNEHLQTDFEFGCTQATTPEVVRASLESGTCKEHLQEFSVSEFEKVLEEVFEAEFGEPVPYVRGKKNSTLQVDTTKRTMSWYHGLVPWFAQKTRWKTDQALHHPENVPFLKLMLSDEQTICEEEFQGESEVNMPCHRNEENEPQIAIPFVVEDYAWPKAKTSVLTDRAVGKQCAGDVMASNQLDCIDFARDRVKNIEKFMIGSDICYYTRKDNFETDFTRMRPCFASFCTTNSHIGIADKEECFNITSGQASEECEDNLDPTQCKCLRTNDKHQNKTICDVQNIQADFDYVRRELPSRQEMNKIRQQHLLDKFRHFMPRHSRCGRRFMSRAEAKERGAQCQHVQGPLGFNSLDQHLFVSSVGVDHLDGKHVVDEDKFYVDKFRVAVFGWNASHSSLWKGDNIKRVLQSSMQYPQGDGKKLYGVLAMTLDELGPTDVELEIDNNDGLNIRRVHLTDSKQARADWLNTLHQDFEEKYQEILASPVYRPALLRQTPNRWVCRYAARAVQTGSGIPSKKLALKTPNPFRARRQLPDLRGLHPLAKLRNVTAEEVKHYQHYGLLHTIWHNNTFFNVSDEIRFLLHGTQSHSNSNKSTASGQMTLGWPSVLMEFWSGEDNAQLKTKFDLASLSESFNVIVKNLWDGGDGSVHTKLRRHHPYPDTTLNITSSTLTTDPGFDCHKGPLSKISRTSLKEMLQFDACFLTHEGPGAQRRTYTCHNSSTSKNFTFNTTVKQNSQAQARDIHVYKTCEKATSVPHTIWVDADTQLPATLPEISRSVRRRISPWFKRASMHGVLQNSPNLNADLTSMLADFDFVTANVSIPVPPFNGSDIFRCEGGSQGTMAQAVWQAHADRNALCQEHKAQCQDSSSEETVDLCKFPAFEDTCVLLDHYRSRIEKINMRAAGLVSDVVPLYTPTAFSFQDSLFSWEIVAKTYESLNLISATCTNVVVGLASFNSAIDQHSISISPSACPSIMFTFFSDLFTKVRLVIVTVANLFVTFSEALANVGLGFVSLVIENAATAGNVQAGSSVGMYFLEQAMQLFIKGIRLAFEFFNEVMFIISRLFSQNTVLKALLKVAEVLCLIFKVIISIIVNIIASIIKVIEEIVNAIPGVGGVNLGSEKMTDTAKEISEISCTYSMEDECRKKKCTSQIFAKIADNCYEDLVADVDVLQGRTTAAFSTSQTWIATLKGNYVCSDLSYCRSDLGKIVYCTQCKDEAKPLQLAQFHCGQDNRCQCGVKPRLPDTCYTRADCSVNSMCSEVNDGFDYSSSTSPCHATDTNEVMCLRSSRDNPVGTCTKVIGYDKSSDCDQVGVNLADFCLVAPNFVNLYAPGVTDVLFDDLYTVRCYQLNANERLSTVAKDVIFAVGQVVCRKVSSEFTASANRRLLSLGIPEKKHAPGGLEAFFAAVQPRLSQVSGPCEPAFHANLSEPVNARRALLCTRWLFFLNHSLPPYGPMDVRMADPRELWRRLGDESGLLLDFALNVPRATAILLSDAFDMPGIVDQAARHWRTGAQLYERGTYHVSVLRQQGPAGTAPSDKPMSWRSNKSHTEQLYLSLAPTTTTHLSAAATMRDADTAQPQPHSRRLLFFEADITSEVDAFRHSVGNQSIIRNLAPAQDRGAFDCIPPMHSLMVGFLQTNLQQALRRDGWKLKPACTPENNQWSLFLASSCPVADTVLWTVLNNTVTLVSYYYYVHQSGCLGAFSNRSCLPPPTYRRETAAAALPNIKRDTTPIDEAGLARDSEDVTAAFVDFSKSLLTWVNFGDTSRQEYLVGFLSFEAAFNLTELDAQVSKNEYSLGRIIREMFTCDLDHTLNCRVVRTPLPAAFFAMFVVIFLLTFFFPIPSVVTFFLWVWGLTFGVVYLAYAFSPLCFPRIPVCLGEGLYDVANIFLPETLEFNSDMMLSPTYCKDINVDNTIQFFIATETLFRQSKSEWMERLLWECQDKTEIWQCETEHRTVQRIYNDFFEEDPGLRKENRQGMYFCTFFNAYRVLVWICVFVFVLPIAMYVLGMTIPIFLQLCAIAASSIFSMLSTTSDALHDDDDENE